MHRALHMSFSQRKLIFSTLQKSWHWNYRARQIYYTNKKITIYYVIYVNYFFNVALVIVLTMNGNRMRNLRKWFFWAELITNYNFMMCQNLVLITNRRQKKFMTSLVPLIYSCISRNFCEIQEKINFMNATWLFSFASDISILFW